MFEYRPSSQHLAGKKILITGASDGIGRANAICFAEHCAELLLLGRNQEKLEPLIQKFPQASFFGDYKKMIDSSNLDCVLIF